MAEKKFGHIPTKSADTKPWEILCVNLIGPYQIKQKGIEQPLILKAVTMIDPVTGWFEITQYDDKKTVFVAEKFEQTWLNCYPWP